MNHSALAYQSSPQPLLPDFPKGPLCVYRKKASFNWKELAAFLDGEDIIHFRKKVFSALEKDPIFARHSGEDLTLERYRELTFLRCKRVFEYNFLTWDEMLEKPLRILILINCLGMYDWSLGAKYLLNTQVFTGAIQGTSERHNEFVKQVEKMEIFGCFALTEISHGSNTKAIRTTAHFDANSQEFIINSPDFEAAKFWVGNMGKTATHAVVYAQLYTPDGQSHGLHSFIVQIRDPKTLLPMAGVMVGDIGRKLGQNGLDNGFAMFHKVRIPRENLINRTGDVTSSGTYTTPFKDPKQQLGATLGALSSGRVSITGMAVANLKLAVSIAIRFSATRQQFGPTDNEELPVLEYQLQQWRLIPYLAAAYILDHFSKSLFMNLVELQFGLLMKDKSARQSDQKHRGECKRYEALDNPNDHSRHSISGKSIRQRMLLSFELMRISHTLGIDPRQPWKKKAELGREIHALSSASKPLASWTAQHAAQECREACGGHGYLAMNRLGDIRNDNDPNCTYEGDNNVLLQQTSNYLLNWMNAKHTDLAVAESPLGSIDFLKDFRSILRLKCTATSVEDYMDASAALAAYKWLVCYLLRESDLKLKQERQNGSNEFDARNNSQVYYCRSLSIAFIELTVLQSFYDYVEDSSTPSTLLPVLKNLCALYGLWSLNKHMVVLYQGNELWTLEKIIYWSLLSQNHRFGGYCSGEKAGRNIQNSILALCAKLKDDAVALVDVIAPPDFILNSPIGRSDGELYKNLWTSVLQGSKVLERPSWWAEFCVNKPQVGSLRSKM